MTHFADVADVPQVLVTQWFAPTKFVITFEGTEKQSDVFETDAQGNVLSIKLPDKVVIMGNHQVLRTRSCEPLV